MEIYLRASDAREELMACKIIIAEMAKDMIELFGDNIYTPENLIEAYMKWYNGPTIFESILIKRNSYTEEEARKNIVLEYMKKRIKEKE